MSAVTEAPGRPATDEIPLASTSPGGSMTSQSLVTVGLAAALVAIGFASGGGVDQNVASSGNTWCEIAVTVLGAAAVATGLLRRPVAERRHGWLAAGLMAAMLALTGASIAWSVAPDSSWLGAAQMLAYLAVFAGAILTARPSARRWAAVIGALVLWSAVLCAWSLLAKVFPATLAPGNTIGRLQAPFGYWNAIALCAAMGLPCCLWLGARRDGGRRLAALAAPALTLLIAVLVLSYSRSADLAAAVAAGLWLLVVPLRLRAIAMLLIGILGATMISAWFLSHRGLDGNYVRLSAQDHAGHVFGILILGVLVLVTIAGVAVSEAMDHSVLGAPTRRRLGSAVVALLVLAAAAAVFAVASSSRGLGGEISYRWHELTSPAATVSAGSAARVFQFGSSRPVYWHEALAVGDSALLKGVGELGFSVARLLHPLSSEEVFQAHGYVFETYADLGILGLAITAALLLAWLFAAVRTLGAGGWRWRALAAPVSAERAGLVTLAAVVLAFGIQSTLDWTWFVTGIAVPALLAAGWVAGRGPDRPAPARGGSLLDRPGSLVVAVLLVAAMIVGCWYEWRPLHSVQLVDRAESSGSLAAARAAQSADPLWLFPYDTLSALDLSLHRPGAALAELEHATRVQPANPQSWESLGQFLVQRRDWARAEPVLQKVHNLDLTGDALARQNDALLVDVAHHLSG